MPRLDSPSTRTLKLLARIRSPAARVMAQLYQDVSSRVLLASAYLEISGNMGIGLYADNAGELGAVIATAGAQAFSSSGHWEEFTFASPPTTVGALKYCSPATPK